MRLSTTMPSLAVFGLTFVAIGCAPKGAYQQAAATGRSLDDTRSQLITTKTEISQTVAAMDALVNKPQGDLKDQFKTFADDVDKLNSGFTAARDRVMDMRANRDQYVMQWQTDMSAISNPELREKARDRMMEAKANFNTLSDAINAVNDSAGPFLADVNDLRRYFGADLTAVGVKSAPDTVTKVHTEADATQAKIDTALVQLDHVGTSIAPTATTAP